MVFLEWNPADHYLPQGHYHLGRAKESVNTPTAADSYRTFLQIKANADGDPLVADARGRAGS